MTLITSVSGMRGTIGGKPGSALTPVDIVSLCSAFGTWVKSQNQGNKVIMGRDARVSGDMVSSLSASTFISLGLDVVDLGITTTPTVEMAVILEKAAAGVIITASHNPGNWNALKFVNHLGEFISPENGQEILKLSANKEFDFSPVENLGNFIYDGTFLQKHIDVIKDLPLVDPESISKRKFKIAVDGVNSSGGLAIPQLLVSLGIEEIIQIHCDPHGNFAHNPEPLPENLKDLSSAVIEHKCDLGIAVDPDVDRLALIDEKGNPFGEEYTLVAVAEYILKNNPGPIVSNLSSSRALKDLAKENGVEYESSEVGEVHVVKKMKEAKAVIGGEGNGGVIYPKLHYGRDALVGVGLILSFLAKENLSLGDLKSGYSKYVISKDRIPLEKGLDIENILEELKKMCPGAEIDERDGVKFDFEDSWVHLRRSNTEPIIRVYAEARSMDEAKKLTSKIKNDLQSIITSRNG